MATAIIFLLLAPKEPEEDVVRQREYTVTRDNITVGVETGGLVEAGPNAHYFEADTVIEELLVKLGSEVKTGDPLASISTENLEELIQSAQNELSDAKAALLQASGSKDILIAQNNKNKQDSLNSTQQEYAAKLESLGSEKNKIETSIQEQEGLRTQLQQQIADCSAQVDMLEQEVERLKNEMNTNTLEIGEWNEELYRIDDSSNERNYLNSQISDLQYEIQELNGELGEKNALATNNAAKINTLESEIQSLYAEIAELEQQGDENNSQYIQELKDQIAAKQQQIRQLSYISDEIDTLSAVISQKNRELRDLQDELIFLSDGSEERNYIQLQITTLQNKNTEIQQRIDEYLEIPAIADLERLRGEFDSCEEKLASEYENLSLKLEEIERTERMFELEMENQNENNAFSDYKTSEELKTINENIAKASRNVQAAQEKVSRLQELADHPTIYAELDGVVTALNYKKGDTIVEGKPLCVIGELGETSVTVPVSAADIGNVSVGQTIFHYMGYFRPCQMYLPLGKGEQVLFRYKYMDRSLCDVWSGEHMEQHKQKFQGQIG